jgi:hypothetical protein
MADFPTGIDPEAAGSRFTSRVAVAVLTRRGGETRFDERGDAGDAQAVVDDVTDPGADGPTDALGERTIIEGSYGRGASSWTPVIEWAAAIVVGGILQGAAWDSVKLAAKQLTSALRGLRDRGVEFAISRGAAAHVAVGHVMETTGDVGVLVVEAVEEPSSLAGRPVTELSYVGSEPWLVSLRNERGTGRYIVAVTPSGEVLDSMSVPISDMEVGYGFPPPRK